MVTEVEVHSRIGLRRIAVGVLHLMTGRASLEFPTSSRAHPSFEVLVVMTPRGPLREGDGAYFPFSVPWDFWEGVVVPVLKDESIVIKTQTKDGLRSPIQMASLTLGDYTDLLSRITEALVASMKAQGLLPSGEETLNSSQTLAPGEPLNRTPEYGSSETYPRYDEPQGLTYPKYDE